ncbi:MAG: glucose-6-phosphate isomerase [Pseudomonadota bacterium]|nr:glucose-6-phosphate isomerase [Pseudomonadota bacterium]
MNNRPYAKETKAWKELESLALMDDYQDIELLFSKYPSRGSDFSLNFDGLYFDYSRQLINPNILNMLISLADQVGVSESIQEMYSGKYINITEDLPALHTLLRRPSSDSFIFKNKDILIDINKERNKVKNIVNKIHDDIFKGFDGSPITDVVNIGIGGSDLGVRMCVTALSEYRKKDLRVHFVSNLDGVELAHTLSLVNPRSTIFIICSKSFSTLETLTNANTARKWFIEHANESAMKDHFFAVSSDYKAMLEFGIADDKCFKIWDWVGGRYSICSSISLSLALSIGWDNFKKLIEGAHRMDIHFRDSPFQENIPVLLALIGIWNRNFLKISSHAILPYDNHLEKLPSYLQQLEMESNGKSVRKDGSLVDLSTAALIWGETGSNAQHSFYQFLHQGTDRVSLDFILPINSGINLQKQQDLVVLNCLAQSVAFSTDNPFSDADESISLNENYSGISPNSLILFRELSPRVLGSLIALYEHKVFVQGIIWGINSFDQWGVEIGKKLAKDIKSIENKKKSDLPDSISHLLEIISKIKK